MKKKDGILILTLALLAAALLLLSRIGGGAGTLAVVSVAGEDKLWLPLARDGVYRIGDGNVLAIEDGRARMREADCPDQICVRHRAVSRAGETIVCLPNRVVVEIRAGGTESGNREAGGEAPPDAVTY